MSQNNFQFIICPDCNGEGEINKKQCKTCHGHGVAADFSGHFLFFWEKFNLKIFWQKKIKKFFRKIFNFFLLVLCLSGAFVFSLILLQTSGQTFIKGISMTAGDLLKRGNPLTLLFWFSILGDMFLFYRLEQDLKWKKRKVIIPTPSPYESLTFPEILNIKSDYKVNVFSSFSDRAESAFLRSWHLAYKLKSSEIIPIHLFAELLLHPKVKEILSRLEVDLYVLKSKLRYQISLMKQKDDKKNFEIKRTDPQLSVDLKKIILRAYFIAHQENKFRLGAFELLSALIEQDPLVKEILDDLEVDLEKVKNVSAWIGFDEEMRRKKITFKSKAFFKPKGVMNKAFTAVATPFLDQYGQDMTAMAKSGYFSLCVEREKEMKQIFQALESRKNGIVLVGESGTGKNAIVEGIAQLMVEEDVPEVLKDKRLISLNIGSLVGGEEMGVETKLKIIINEIIRAGNIILFIDSISNIVGVKSLSGEMDISEMLASYLGKNYFVLFSTCAPEDYQVLKNSSLSNILEKIIIEEPKGNQAILILESKIGFLENHHQVYFSYKAISQAVELSSKYLPDKCLPEKGVSLLEEAAVYVSKLRGKNSFVKKEDIAYLLSRKTKIPLTKITEKESEKLLNLETRIHQRIIGQEEAVKAVSDALRRARTELRDAKRPIANLLFLGPTGVGKTELAKAISEIYFGSEKQMIRLDMSEYQEKISTYRLIGSPMGASGERIGYLTEAVKKQPFSLLLLDEIEKAHHDILNLFLQVMEDGRLTDGVGKTVDFTNVILIGTSNAGSNFIQEKIKENKSVEEIKNGLLNKELKSYFLPEFLNRFDETIVFKPLTLKEIKQIAHLLLAGLQKQLFDKGITLQATDEAVEELSELGYDPVFGARPLRRVIQERVNNALANYLLKGDLKRRDIAVLEKGGVIRVVKGREL